MVAKWTDSEIEIIKDNYKTMSDDELSLLIPAHTKCAIETKRRKLGLKRPYWNKKYSFQDVISEMKNRNYELISTEKDFVNVGSDISYICDIHKDIGVQHTTLGHLLEGKGCKYCGRVTSGIKRQIDFDKDEDKLLAESKGFVYIDTFRQNGKISIKFICNNHKELGVQVMAKTNMQRDIKGCKYCSGKQLPSWYVLEKAQEVNPYIELLDDYKDLTTRMHCICTKHNHKTVKTMQDILNGQGCYYCGIEKLRKECTLSNEEVESRIHIRNPHVNLIKYNGANEMSEWICTKHNKVFKKFFNTLTSHDSGCEECYKELIRNRDGMGQDEFDKRLSEVHPELKVIGSYINNSTPIEVFCTKHNYSYFSTPVSLLSRLTCCDKTRITYKEEAMCQLIESWGYKITRQKTFDGCKDTNVLKFDCYLDDYNVVIEYDGEQHFFPISFGAQSRDEAIKKYEYTKRHDEIKMNFVIITILE